MRVRLTKSTRLYSWLILLRPSAAALIRLTPSWVGPSRAQTKNILPSPTLVHARRLQLKWGGQVIQMTVFLKEEKIILVLRDVSLTPDICTLIASRRRPTIVHRAATNAFAPLRLLHAQTWTAQPIMERIVSAALDPAPELVQASRGDTVLPNLADA